MYLWVPDFDSLARGVLLLSYRRFSEDGSHSRYQHEVRVMSSGESRVRRLHVDSHWMFIDYSGSFLAQVSNRCAALIDFVVCL